MIFQAEFQDLQLLDAPAKNICAGAEIRFQRSDISKNRELKKQFLFCKRPNRYTYALMTGYAKACRRASRP
jgi:hypothetical protein